MGKNRPKKLGSLYSSRPFPWDASAESCSARQEPRGQSQGGSLRWPLTSVTVDVEKGAEDVFEVSIDEGATEKEIAVRPFNPQTYRQKEVQLTILQVS